MRLGPVLFIAVSVAFVVFLFMVVGAAKAALGEPLNPGSSKPGRRLVRGRSGSARGGARRRPSRRHGLQLRPRPLRQPPRLRWAAVAVDTRSRPPHPEMRHPPAGLLAQPLSEPLVRDRGPFVWGRSLDLTEAAVRRFGFASARSWGVRYLEWKETR